MFWRRNNPEKPSSSESEEELLRNVGEDDLKDRLLLAVIGLQKEHLAVERSRVFWARARYMTLIVPLVAMGVYLVFMTGLQAMERKMQGYVALVELHGGISDEGSRSGRMLATSVIKGFEDDRALGVILRINSGGGQAMQSALVRDAIESSKARHPEKRLIVVAEDIMASGAYLIASGAHKIYAHEMTMVGSIGAKMESWGFNEALERLGIEHRSFSAGPHKTRLSPFESLSETDEEKAQALVSEIHERFMTYVKTGRGDRLLAESDVVFSGDIWLGAEALDMGLIDGFGTIRTVMRDEFGTDRVLDYSPQKSWRDEAPSLLSAAVEAAVVQVRRFW